MYPFNRMLSKAISGLETNPSLYVDDIIVFGCCIKHHNKNLMKNFSRLRKYNLKLNPKKRCFLQPEVVYSIMQFTKDPDSVRRSIDFHNYLFFILQKVLNA